MIDGLHFDVTSDELKDLLMFRANFHRNKIDEYQAMDTSLMPDGAGTSFDPRKEVERKIITHTREAVLHEFLAEHVIPDEIYRLSKNELSVLKHPV